MSYGLILLAAGAVAAYFLVLGAHALRWRFGLAFFHAILGGVTAIMSWVTDAGVVVQAGGVTFMVGSVVFYTALLLGVFVVYVFDGPVEARVAILVVAAVSVLTPAVAAALHALPVDLGPAGVLAGVPQPSLRINTASVLATVADLFFLAMAWEFLGKPRLRLGLGGRAFLTLLGVMWLDVALFATGAFAGTPAYLGIVKGSLITRIAMAVFAWPFLYGYLAWQNRQAGSRIEMRPVLAILREVAQVRGELQIARDEIQRRKEAERKNRALIADLQDALAQVRRLEGLLSVCSGCKRIRMQDPATPPEKQWVSLEEYAQANTKVRLSHGLCHDCLRQLYPDVADDVTQAVAARAGRGR